MSNNRSSPTAKETLKNVHDLVCDQSDIISLPIDKVRAELADFGMDPTALGKEAKQKVAALLAASKLAAARESRLKRLASKAAFTAKRIPQTRQGKLEYLQQLTAGSSQGISALFRKYEHTSDADLDSLIEDLEFLKSTADDSE